MGFAGSPTGPRPEKMLVINKDSAKWLFMDWEKLRREEPLTYLREVTSANLPEFTDKLSEAETHQLADLVEDVVRVKTAGLDKFYEGAAAMSRFIPNFILQKMVPHFFEAPLAARVTEKMPVKESIAIAMGLADPYLADVCYALDRDLAVEIFETMKVHKGKKIFRFLMEKYPLKGLELASLFSAGRLRELTNGLPWTRYTIPEPVTEEQKAGRERCRPLGCP